jgi:hypothetical protein
MNKVVDLGPGSTLVGQTRRTALGTVLLAALNHGTIVREDIQGRRTKYPSLPGMPGQELQAGIELDEIQVARCRIDGSETSHPGSVSSSACNTILLSKTISESPERVVPCPRS